MSPPMCKGLVMRCGLRMDLAEGSEYRGYS